MFIWISSCTGYPIVHLFNPACYQGKLVWGIQWDISPEGLYFQQKLGMWKSHRRDCIVMALHHFQKPCQIHEFSTRSKIWAGRMVGLEELAGFGQVVCPECASCRASDLLYQTSSSTSPHPTPYQSLSFSASLPSLLLLTPWTAAHQASLPSQTPGACSNSCPLSWWCHPAISSSAAALLFLLSIFLSFRVFSSELALSIRWPNYWSVGFNISPSNESSGISLPWLHVLLYQGLSSNADRTSRPTQPGQLLPHPSQFPLCLGEFSWYSLPDKPFIPDYMLMGATQVVLVIKKLPANAGDVRDLGSTPGMGRSPGGGSGNPLQYSCLENPMDGGAWWATVHGVTKSQTRLSMHTHANELHRNWELFHLML